MDDNYQKYVDLIKMNYHPKLHHHIKFLDNKRLMEIIKRCDETNHLDRLNKDIFPVIDYIYKFYYYYYDILNYVLNIEDLHDNHIHVFYQINLGILNHFLAYDERRSEIVNNKLSYLVHAKNFIEKLDKKYSLWGLRYNPERNYYIMLFTICFYSKYYPTYDSSVLEDILKKAIEDDIYLFDEMSLDGAGELAKSHYQNDIVNFHRYIEIYIDRKIFNKKIIK